MAIGDEYLATIRVKVVQHDSQTNQTFFSTPFDTNWHLAEDFVSLEKITPPLPTEPGTVIDALVKDFDPSTGQYTENITLRLVLIENSLGDFEWTAIRIPEHWIGDNEVSPEYILSWTLVLAAPSKDSE